MHYPSTERAILLQEQSRRLRRYAQTTRTKSHLLHDATLRLHDAARRILIESSVHSRRRLAGGSSPLGDASASFALSIGHELTPALATLLLRLESMLGDLRDGDAPADLAGDLETLHHRAKQMTVIVKALTALGGDSRFEPQPVDLNAIIDDVLLSTVPRLGGGIAVRAHLDRDLAAVLADTEALRYALTSFIETVAERSPTLDIGTRRETNGAVRVDIGASRKPGTVRELTLPDDPLRLVLAQSIVHSLGGTVEQRIANPGRTFTITLRAADTR